MKQIIFFLIVLSFFGCSPEAKFQKAINNFGQKESAKYITEHYPEYFVNKADTVRDTVRIKTIHTDTIISIKNTTDTIKIIKDKLKIQMYIRHDSIFVSGECKGDTIYVEKIVSYKEPNKEMLISTRVSFKAVLGLIFMGCFFVLLLYFWIKEQNKQEQNKQI